MANLTKNYLSLFSILYQIVFSATSIEIHNPTPMITNIKKNEY